jgi:hypothetical protein
MSRVTQVSFPPMVVIIRLLSVTNIARICDRRQQTRRKAGTINNQSTFRWHQKKTKLYRNACVGNYLRKHNNIKDETRKMKEETRRTREEN